MESPDYHHEEILLFRELATRVGQNFARRRGKHNPQFVDECVTEALFWLVVLMNEKQEEIQRQENLEAYLRRKIGFKLFEYWCLYTPSTLSYLLKKGKHVVSEVEITEGARIDKHSDIDVMICLDNAVRTDMEKKIYQLSIEGGTHLEISVALQIREMRVRKILSRIKKRLKNYNQEVADETA